VTVVVHSQPSCCLAQVDQLVRSRLGETTGANESDSTGHRSTNSGSVGASSRAQPLPPAGAHDAPTLAPPSAAGARVGAGGAHRRSELEDLEQWFVSAQIAKQVGPSDSHLRESRVRGCRGGPPRIVQGDTSDGTHAAHARGGAAAPDVGAAHATALSSAAGGSGGFHRSFTWAVCVPPTVPSARVHDWRCKAQRGRWLAVCD
jgi:hypothetical protein